MLKYTGKGFLIGVPARDLTDKEAERYGRQRLIKSGLYVSVKSKRLEAVKVEEIENDERNQST